MKIAYIWKQLALCIHLTIFIENNHSMFIMSTIKLWCVSPISKSCLKWPYCYKVEARCVKWQGGDIETMSGSNYKATCLGFCVSSETQGHKGEREKEGVRGGWKREGVWERTCEWQLSPPKLSRLSINDRKFSLGLWKTHTPLLCKKKGVLKTIW